jgi:hypothetical protein
MAIDPNYNLPYYGAYLALWDHNDRERALSYLDLWVSRHPDDAQARQLLVTRRGELGGRTMPVPGLKPPAIPGTP